MKNKRGITLIALVITIIILLILAGITISQLTENGLFNKVKLAKERYKNAQMAENDILSQYENKIVGSRDTITIDKSEYEELKSRGNYELIGEGSISSTSSKIELNKSIEEYRYLLLSSHLNNKNNNDWVDNTIIPAKLNYYNTIVMHNSNDSRYNTIYMSTNTTLSVYRNETTNSTWASTYVIVYGIK